VNGLQWKTALCMAGLMIQPAALFSWAQEPAPPAAPSLPATQAPAAAPSKPGKKKYSHVNDFLIRGTIFNEKAVSFPGVELRIRVAGEKKFRWESYTNSRGEFAMRVPQGASYEMVVRVKGFAEQTHTIEAKNGGGPENLVFRMQPTEGSKK
jgi:hypothetical protein